MKKLAFLAFFIVATAAFAQHPMTFEDLAAKDVIAAEPASAKCFGLSQEPREQACGGFGSENIELGKKCLVREEVALGFERVIG